GPLATKARFELIAATENDTKSLKGLGTYGFIKNPAGFIVGAVEQGCYNLEDYGYLLEKIVLNATEIGLGTCWVGGLFTKSNFAKKINIHKSEIIPAVAAIGYSSEDKLREIMRRKMNADRRLPSSQLFFSDAFDHPLKINSADPFSTILEMVRLAPSASNKQPWRIVKIGNAWHFYLQRTKGYGKGTLTFGIFRIADLQRVDIGIAMCHFELTAESLGLHGKWSFADPELMTAEGTEYVVTWIEELL
ncbi:MAG: nitroreductase family protein, partial [Bacteroidetes bacterium]|nr:nitroreductase family protein [Bacteroidota bacterium]